MTCTCILCLISNKNKVKITLNELIIDKTVKEVIIEQFSNHELILTGPLSVDQLICQSCFDIFKAFYRYKKLITQKFLEVLPAPVAFVNFVKVEEPVLDYDLKQLEINIERVKTEPEDVEQFVNEFQQGGEFEEISGVFNDKKDSDFEWKHEEDDPDYDEEINAKTSQKKQQTKTKESDIEINLLSSKKRRYVRVKETPKSTTKDDRVRQFCELKCNECNLPMESYFQLSLHFRDNHPDIKTYLNCGRCGRKFTRRSTLMNHLDVHDESTIYRCEICFETFKTVQGWQTHRRRHNERNEANSKEKETFVCSECGKTLTSLYSFNKHMVTHEVDALSRTFECFKCHSTYKNEKLLRAHFYQSHNLDRPKTKKCKICGKELKSSGYSAHMRNVHSLVKPPKSQCNICQHWIIASKLYDHMKKHSDPGVNCDICGKFLKSKDSIWTHKKTVHGDARHQCSYCDKKFRDELKLKEHVAAQHTKEILFRCRVCGRGFRARGKWKMHEKNSHPVEYEKLFKPYFKRAPNENQANVEEALKELEKEAVNFEEPDAGVTCNICDQYIRKSSWLDKHKRDFHSGKEPRFSCTYCDAKFTQEQKWREHTAAQHTKEFLYFCRVEGCGRGFAAKFSWKRHEMTTHPEEYEKLPK